MRKWHSILALMLVSLSFFLLNVSIELFYDETLVVADVGWPLPFVTVHRTNDEFAWPTCLSSYQLKDFKWGNLLCDCCLAVIVVIGSGYAVQELNLPLVRLQWLFVLISASASYVAISMAELNHYGYPPSIDIVVSAVEQIARFMIIIALGATWFSSFSVLSKLAAICKH